MDNQDNDTTRRFPRTMGEAFKDPEYSSGFEPDPHHLETQFTRWGYAIVTVLSSVCTAVVVGLLLCGKL